MNITSTPKAPAAIGPYSQAIAANGFLFASGQIPLNPVTGEIIGSTQHAADDAAIITSSGMIFIFLPCPFLFKAKPSVLSSVNDIRRCCVIFRLISLSAALSPHR